MLLFISFMVYDGGNQQRVSAPHLLSVIAPLQFEPEADLTGQ